MLPFDWSARIGNFGETMASPGFDALTKSNTVLYNPGYRSLKVGGAGNVTLVELECTKLTGTASVTAGAAAVTGVGTNFDPEVAVGDALIFYDYQTQKFEEALVKTVTNDTAIVLETNAVNTFSGVDIYVSKAVIFAVVAGEVVPVMFKAVRDTATVGNTTATGLIGLK